MATSNNISFSYNGTCTATGAAVEFHTGTNIAARVSSNSTLAPFQIVIRQKVVDRSKLNGDGSLSNGGVADPLPLAGIDDTEALELANLINAWFSKHEHIAAHPDDAQTVGLPDTLITGIYLHITYKDTVNS